MGRHPSNLLERTDEVTAGQSTERGQFRKARVAGQVVKESARHSALLERREHSALRRGIWLPITAIETAIHSREMRDHRQEDVVGKECRGVLWSRQHWVECACEVQHCFVGVFKPDGAMQPVDS